MFILVEDAALVLRIAEGLKAPLELSLGVAATINVHPPSGRPWLASIGFDLEERIVDVEIIDIAQDETHRPVPVSAGGKLETGGPGATVYNLDLTARVRDAVKDALRSAFDVIRTEADKGLYTNDSEDRSARAQFECEIAGQSVEIGVLVGPPI
jgi:hypothetical protein